VCDLETSRMGAPYIYDISHLRVKETWCCGSWLFPSLSKEAPNLVDPLDQVILNQWLPQKQ